MIVMIANCIASGVGMRVRRWVLLEAGLEGVADDVAVVCPIPCFAMVLPRTEMCNMNSPAY